jgi:Heavy metal associated domain 2
MIELAHGVPGRLRVRVATIRGNGRVADEVRAMALAVPGVTAATASTATGSLVVTYDRGRLTQDALWSELRRRLGEAAPMMARDGGETEWIDHAASAAADALVGRLLERSVALLVRAVI